MSNQINLHATNPLDEIAWPEEAKGLTAQSNALQFFHDFSVAKPLITSPTTLAVDAIKQMNQAHENFAVVLNEQDHFLGIIDKASIDCPKFISTLSKGYKRDELTVDDLILDRKSLKVIDYSQIESSTITDVVTTLREHGEHHCIVLEECQHKIRGVLLGDKIARQLKLPIEDDNRPTFLSIFQAIN